MVKAQEENIGNRRRKVPEESAELEEEIILRRAQDCHSSSSAVALECVWKIIPTTWTSHFAETSGFAWENKINLNDR